MFFDILYMYTMFTSYYISSYPTLLSIFLKILTFPYKFIVLFDLFIIFTCIDRNYYINRLWWICVYVSMYVYVCVCLWVDGWSLVIEQIIRTLIPGEDELFICQHPLNFCTFLSRGGSLVIFFLMIACQQMWCLFMYNIVKHVFQMLNKTVFSHRRHTFQTNKMVIFFIVFSSSSFAIFHEP